MGKLEEAVRATMESRRKTAQRETINSFARNILVGGKKSLMHPLDLLDGLQDFGDFLFETGYTPTLAAMAVHMKLSKSALYCASSDNKQYYYYDVQNHMGESISQKAVYAQDDLDDVKHGANVSLLPFLDIDFLIDNYETIHLQDFTAEERNKIKAFKSMYIKRLHSNIKSKKRCKNLVSVIHSIQAFKGVYRADVITRRRKINRILFNAQTSKWKDIYAMCVTGNVIVKTITFQEILEFYRNVSEIEWLELGKSARNPALSIFLLMNNSGYNPMYQNKTITEYKPTLSAMEEAHYAQRLEEVLHPQISANKKN